MVKRAFYSVLAFLMFCASAQATCSNGLPLQSTATPSLPGRVVFQAKDAGGNMQIYLYDFASGQQTNLSTSWTISSYTNPVFSPNGKYIAFTAIPANNCCHDVYVFQLGASAPIDVTNKGSSYRSEDPKWAPNGQQLVIKQNANIVLLPLSFNASGVPSASGTTTAFTTDGVINTTTESSQPFFSADGKYVYYARGLCSAGFMNYSTCSSAKVYKINASAGSAKTIYSVNGHYAYYPVVRDFTAVFYTGWINSSLPGNDQILVQSDALLGTSTYLDGGFNDCTSQNSDAAAVDSDYILFSSTSPLVTSTGNYRPVLANINTNLVWALPNVGAGATAVLGLNYTAAR